MMSDCTVLKLPWTFQDIGA